MPAVALSSANITTLLVVGLAVLVWQQRTYIKDKFDNCDLQATFFGVHLDAPQSVIDQCNQHLKRHT